MKDQKIELPEHDCLYETTNDSGFIDQEPAYRKSTVLRLIEADRQRRGEPVYAYRRKGLNDFATCTDERFNELSKNDLFETRIFYTTPQPAEPVKPHTQFDDPRVQQVYEIICGENPPA